MVISRRRAVMRRRPGRDIILLRGARKIFRNGRDGVRYFIPRGVPVALHRDYLRPVPGLRAACDVRLRGLDAELYLALDYEVVPRVGELYYDLFQPAALVAQDSE